MTEKEFLNQARDIDRQIKFDLAELEEIRAKVYSISSPNYTEKVSGTHSSAAPFECALERLWEREEKLGVELAELESKRAEIMAAIRSVGDGEEMLILQYRYIDGMKWDDIADKMFLSKSTIKRKHEDALSKIILPK